MLLGISYFFLHAQKQDGRHMKLTILAILIGFLPHSIVIYKSL